MNKDKKNNNDIKRRERNQKRLGEKKRGKCKRIKLNTKQK